jgi:hypothetical protein
VASQSVWSSSAGYPLLKPHDLITSPAFIVIKVADEFHDKTTAPNQLWQTDFTYLKVSGWGSFYLSTVLDDSFRYIIAWKLCTTMKAEAERFVRDMSPNNETEWFIFIERCASTKSDNGATERRFSCSLPRALAARQ